MKKTILKEISAFYYFETRYNPKLNCYKLIKKKRIGYHKIFDELYNATKIVECQKCAIEDYLNIQTNEVENWYAYFIQYATSTGETKLAVFENSLDPDIDGTVRLSESHSDCLLYYKNKPSAFGIVVYKDAAEQEDELYSNSFEDSYAYAINDFCQANK